MSMPRNKGVLLVLVLLCASCQMRPADLSGPLMERDPIAQEMAAVEVSKLKSDVALLLKDGKWQEAEALLREQLERQPNHLAAQTNLGLLLAKTDRQEQAVQILENVLARNAGACPAAIQLAEIYLAQYSIEQAEQAYRRCLGIHPDESAALLNLGILLELYRGELLEAIDLYERYQQVTSDADDSVARWITDLNRRVEAVSDGNQLAEVRR